jgi:hypothetical protein
MIFNIFILQTSVVLGILAALVEDSKMFDGKNVCTGTGPVASRVASRWRILRNELFMNTKCYASLLLVWFLVMGVNL